MCDEARELPERIFVNRASGGVAGGAVGMLGDTPAIIRTRRAYLKTGMSRRRRLVKQLVNRLGGPFNSAARVVFERAGRQA
jgi:hypothetical protein